MLLFKKNHFCQFILKVNIHQIRKTINDFKDDIAPKNNNIISKKEFDSEEEDDNDNNSELEKNQKKTMIMMIQILMRVIMINNGLWLIPNTNELISTRKLNGYNCNAYYTWLIPNQESDDKNIKRK
jgi:hypothetical protein